MIVKRYTKANNRYLPNFNPNDPESYLIYLDANNLYGYGMSQLLPHSKFKFLSLKKIQQQFTPMTNLKDILDLLVGGNSGYMFDADIEYPRELHDSHSDYPLAPGKLTVDPTMYSPFMKEHYKQQTSSGTTTTIYIIKQIISYTLII